MSKPCSPPSASSPPPSLSFPGIYRRDHQRHHHQLFRGGTIDDYIRIGDQKEKVIDINFTKIALLNEDDDVIFIPNAKFFSSEIVNYTKREIKKVNIEFEVLIQNIKTVEELEADLIHAISDYEIHIERGSYNLRIVEIRKDSLSLKFQYDFLREINRELEREIRRKTARRIVNYVKQNLGQPKGEG
ncbi:MAG: mechanosensitive ion channel [Lewinellaceae bacterium]|nr:mechanosensitive ion channel [Lewinellaceae bacterium]